MLEGAKTRPESAPAKRKPRLSLRRLLVIAAATYSAVCGFLYVYQPRLVFVPSAEYRFTPLDVGLAFEDLTLITSDGLPIAAWYVPHPTPTCTVLFCHGNAGNMGDRMLTIQTLHALGCDVLIFDYRGYGRSEGSPDEEGTYLDAEAAWRYLTETRGLSPQHLVYLGRSLGGAVSVELATRHEPAALVVESTFTRFVDVAAVHYPLVPVQILSRYEYDSAARVAVLSCPKLFLHGTDDELVPIELGRRLYEAAATPKRFVQTPGGHNSSGFTYSDWYADQLGAFLAEVFTPPGDDFPP
jgi:fermentation-respiration switch protein FrsA (DUF1100 family)